jgi:hypothetical protein
MDEGVDRVIILIIVVPWSFRSGSQFIDLTVELEIGVCRRGCAHEKIIQKS